MLKPPPKRDPIADVTATEDPSKPKMNVHVGLNVPEGAAPPKEQSAISPFLSSLLSRRLTYLIISIIGILPFPA